MQVEEFFNYKNWVVIGDVLNKSKYASKILEALKSSNFNVTGINPRDTSGEVYKNLRDIPYKIEIIDLCINPITGLKIMQEAAELGIDKVLIQPGAESQEILNYCAEKGIIAIEGCALVELNKRD